MSRRASDTLSAAAGTQHLSDAEARPGAAVEMFTPHRQSVISFVR
ncbi:hypothetical protein [Streptomyces sp. NBC_01408]|nr:hypothetical protein [Streptomyces sp. NBC_01408]MCX4694810.1 hypothetical protein [Streptomyces sp. NBC_01408]